MSGMLVHKFGGSSLADAARIAHVAELLRARPEPEHLVVVSAMQGVTDALLALPRLAARGDPGLDRAIEAVEQRHQDAARTLLGADARHCLDALAEIFADLRVLLRAQRLLAVPGSDAEAWVLGLGELCSARLLNATLAARGSDYALLDARDVLVASHGELGVEIDWSASATRWDQWRRRHRQPRVVATGFVAREPSGRATTLGRNGSDFSASIFGRLAAAAEIHIWTDVDGVLSADPRRVPEARLLERLSYDEAFELAYFGAKVVHPQTMAPALAAGIPVIIRNTFAPDRPGTRIEHDSPDDQPVKGFSTIDDLALLTVEGAGMIGVPGTAERVFGALRAAGVSVVMISQGSSEHSICCAIREHDGPRAVAALRRAFAHELEAGQIQDLRLEPGISILAVVGDRMAGRPGIAAQVFRHLARAQVNVRAIAQGASERNISVAVARADATRALRAVHGGFTLSPLTVSIGLIGPGTVGRALLAQLAAQQTRLRETAGLNLRLRAVASSRRMLLGERELDPATTLDTLASQGMPCELEAFRRHVQAEHLPHAVIIDCSASAEVAGRYRDWLSRGIHVITPNKQAGSGPWPAWQALQAACRNSGARWRYEATVGAGLPVIQTLRDLLDTGDRLLAIDGLLSGTLAWLFNRFDGRQPFSALVAEARRLGYTEPDPRDDLSGIDVARKLVILGREAGLALSLDQVEVESLVPADLRSGDVDSFLAGLPAHDAAMAQRLEQARRERRVLRHVATLDLGRGRAAVGLRALPMDHAFAHAALTDNIVQFRSQRYRDNPLVVQGPGAGPEVTAAGVFADLLRVAATLGAAL